MPRAWSRMSALLAIFGPSDSGSGYRKRRLEPRADSIEPRSHCLREPNASPDSRPSCALREPSRSSPRSYSMASNDAGGPWLTPKNTNMRSDDWKSSLRPACRVSVVRCLQRGRSCPAASLLGVLIASLRHTHGHPSNTGMLLREKCKPGTHKSAACLGRDPCHSVSPTRSIASPKTERVERTELG